MAHLQQRTLIRARDLDAFRRALVTRALAGDPLDARRRVIIVPTRASAEVLRQSIEQQAQHDGRAAIVLPSLLTRDEWMANLHRALPGAPPLLSRFEREVIFERAARQTASRPRLGRAPFHIRPGLIAAALDFYDELHRRQRTVRRFARTIFDQLRGERGTDRGSDSLIHQTCFLAFAFLGYERGVAASGSIDEHDLRARILAEMPALTIDEVIVGVADHPTDPRGLWPADFDLLGRLRTIARIDVVMTDETHDAGFRERLERELPGIAEGREPAIERAAPVLVAPEGAENACLVSRDREEELRDVVRAIRARVRETPSSASDSTAVVFHRRLPYLYLAKQVCEDGRVACQTFDALPLAAEPWAALLDLTLAMARTGGTREAATSLLRSRLLDVRVDAARVGLRDVAALDAVLLERRSSGEADSYPSEVDRFFGTRDTRRRLERVRAARAAGAAADVRRALLPFREADSASAQIGAITSFLKQTATDTDDRGETYERHRRARAAVLGVLDGLADGYRRHDDRAREPDALVAAIHHAVEDQTFAPRTGTGGVHLIDAVAARFGAFDHVHLVGLVETDWPERVRRTIFYTSGLLKSLGWPQDVDHGRAQQAAFRDLVALPGKTLHLHAFQLEGDSIVALSPMVDVARNTSAPASARTRSDAIPERLLTFSDEILAGASDSHAAMADAAQEAWLGLRRSRPPLTDDAYAGHVAAREPASYRVSAIDHYIRCPFKYFSEHVLGLPAERDDEAGLTPLERGTLVHELFERFYREWHASGRGSITSANLPEAVDAFTAIAHDVFRRLPEADRVLEETRLLGSIVARGLAERVFESEADAGADVVDRRIEFPLEGPFAFPRLGGFMQREIAIRGKADRIDIFRDGSLCVIDYKLGRLPANSSVQVGVYAHCARQLLEKEDGRAHPVAAAVYLAFGDPDGVQAKLGTRHEPPAIAAEAKAAAFAATVEQIEAGVFPPKPEQTSDCATCAYAGICRKEYAQEDDGAAESV